MWNMKNKDKYIILGDTGSGKSIYAHKLIQKNNGTTVIFNGVSEKNHYLNDLPFLKSFIQMDTDRPVQIIKDGKYYITNYKNNKFTGMDIFMDIMFNENYGSIAYDPAAFIVCDDLMWQFSVRQNKIDAAMLLWRLSHADCGVVITGQKFSDILNVNDTLWVPQMLKDIKKFWNVVRMDKVIKLDASAGYTASTNVEKSILYK